MVARTSLGVTLYVHCLAISTNSLQCSCIVLDSGTDMDSNCTSVGECTVRSESRCALRLRYVDLVVSTDVAVECAVVSLYSALNSG
jgi:hypothetical protein